MSEATRAWIYRISVALVALAVIYGLVNDEQAAGWVGLVLALTGNGLASLNTSTKSE
jgi:hypothetical protein